MEATLEQSAPSYTMVKMWAFEFKRGREIIEDESTTQENIEKVYDLIIEDRRLKIRVIAKTVNISYERAQNIVINEMMFSKIFARWVPSLLSVEQKRNQLTISRDCLELFEDDPQEFLEGFVTIDETWLHRYTPG